MNAGVTVRGTPVRGAAQALPTRSRRLPLPQGTKDRVPEVPLQGRQPVDKEPRWCSNDEDDAGGRLELASAIWMNDGGLARSSIRASVRKRSASPRKSEAARSQRSKRPEDTCRRFGCNPGQAWQGGPGETTVPVAFAGAGEPAVRDVPASGFGADLLRIADLAGGRAEATQ